MDQLQILPRKVLSFFIADVLFLIKQLLEFINLPPIERRPRLLSYLFRLAVPGLLLPAGEAQVEGGVGGEDVADEMTSQVSPLALELGQHKLGK